MKFWKNWPYWLRGGVIGAIAGLALDMPTILTYGENVTWVFLFLGSPMFLVALLLPKLFSLPWPQIAFIVPLTSVLFSFLIGCIIGGIVGLIKKKKSPLA